MNEPHAGRTILFSCLAAALIAGVFTCGLGVVGVAVIMSALSHIDVDPVAVNEWVNAGIVAMLKDGTPDQKVQLLHQLRDSGPAAEPFIPAMVECLADDDPAVRHAAAEALLVVDPFAAEQAGAK